MTLFWCSLIVLSDKLQNITVLLDYCTKILVYTTCEFLSKPKLISLFRSLDIMLSIVHYCQ